MIPQGLKLASLKALSLFHPLNFLCYLVDARPSISGLRNGMSGYPTTTGARPSVGYAIDGLDLDGIRISLQEGIITSEELVEV